MNPSQKGDISEAKVMAELVAQGKTVLIPWGDNDRFDFVVYNELCGGPPVFQRVQVKTGKLKNGVITFHTCSSTRKSANNEEWSHKDYTEDVDFFGVYCPQNNKSYWVPIEDVPKTLMSLRVDESKNKQAQCVNWAYDYEIDRM